MNKSNTALIIIGILLIIGAVSSLTSQDIDELCNTDNDTLIRIGGTWSCQTMPTCNSTEAISWNGSNYNCINT